ncbi:MAG: hypothetical protein IKF72_11880 [Kiritimatiellae bacterium]|nr:hypothetical protein [Kiritimatiellia bacterium]
MPSQTANRRRSSLPCCWR